MQQSKSKPIIFILSIDTEEEWDWSGAFPQHNADVNNVALLPSFHKHLAALGLRPTYLVDYAVADCPTAASTMREIIAKGNCEIGAHLHPWCNPPYFGPATEESSHVVNLPKEHVSQKLNVLMQRIEEQFSIKAKSFRTGRWGIDSTVIKLLAEAGITVDSSVYPFYSNDYFSCIGAPSLPYWPDLASPLETSSQRDLFELPVTVGFNRPNFSMWNDIHSKFATPPYSWTRFNGIAWHTNFLRKQYLCPELSAPKDMLSLCETVINKDYSVLHMYMHSSSLLDNNNSLLGNRNAYEFICESISEVVKTLSEKYALDFCTLSEAAIKLQQQTEQENT